MKILSNDLLIFDINKFILMLQKVFMKIYIDFAKVVETRFDPLNYELERPLPRGKNKKVGELIKDKLGGKIMTELFTLRLKKNLTDDLDENEKSKATKKFVIK